MRLARKVAYTASLFMTFLASSCTSSHLPIVDESLQKSTTFQLAMIGVRSYSMLSSSPASNGQVFYGRAFSLYNDNGVLKLYSNGMIGELSGEPIAVLSIGKDKKAMLLEDSFGQNYVVILSEKGEKKMYVYRINSEKIEYDSENFLDFEKIFVAGRLMLTVGRNELRLYSYENGLLSLKKTIKNEGEVKVFSSHFFSSFIVMKKNGECIILGEVEGETKIPPSSYNAALYYDGRIKKTYVVIFDEGGNVQELYEVEEQ